MTLQPPPIDRRPASVLRAALAEIAPTVAPDWYGPGREGTFGRALIEIAARMGEETTRRLELTPRRDALAFFEALDIAPAPPQAAEATMVFALGESRQTPVLAPSRLRVSAAAEPEEVAFETDAALPLTPARLVDLVAVDPTADRLERTPDQVLKVARPELPVGDYALTGFADTGSQIIQLNPILGIEAGDLLRIGDGVYRVEQLDGDLVVLLDALEAPAAEGSVARKIVSFESFDQRDLQEHAFFVSHNDLLNLEQRASISLCFTPESVARSLADLNISYALWGTLETESDPAWHELGQVSAAGGTVQLAKNWLGSVDETEIAGQSGRWLRAKLLGPLVGPSSVSVRAARVEIQVQSIPDPARPEPPSADANGTQTIDAAFHNSNPLGVSGRFLPFGPEPRRFDTFAVAAPEAFSKRGADVSLAFTLVDASITAIAVPHNADGGSRAYGVGRNGKLQVLEFESVADFGWRELNPPPDSSGGQLLLDDSVIHAVSLEAGSESTADLVLVSDRNGDWWIASVAKVQGPVLSQPDWKPVAAPPTAQTSEAGGVEAMEPQTLLGSAAFVAVPRPAVAASDAAMLALVRDGQLHVLFVSSLGESDELWKTAQLDAPVPELGGRTRLIPIAGAPPTNRIPGDDVDLVLVDVEGKIWRTSIGVAPLQADFRLLDGARPASLDVVPAATFFASDGGLRLFVAWALADGGSVVGASQLGMSELRRYAAAAAFGNPVFKVPDGGRLLVNTTALPSKEDRPAVAALGRDALDRGVAMVWENDERLNLTPLPRSETTDPKQPDRADIPDAALLIPGTDSGPPYLAFAGAGETMFLAAIGDPDETVDVVLHDGLTLVASVDAEYLVLYNGPESSEGTDTPETVISLANRRRLRSGNERVYEVSSDTPDETPNRILEPEQAYRLLASANDPDVDFEGTIEALLHSDSDGSEIDYRNRLTLDAGDDETEQGDYLLIAGELYQILSITPINSNGARQATIDSSLPGSVQGRVPYSVFFKISENRVKVEPGDLGTLVSLPDRNRVPELSRRMAFESGDPSRQKMKLAGRSGGTTWVKVREPWEVEPFGMGSGETGSGEATLLGELVVNPGWVARGPDRGINNPELSWEFFDGDGWRLLNTDFSDTTNNLLNSGVITFRLPETTSATSVGGQENFWIRARLVGGDYGQAVTVVTSETNKKGDLVQTVTFDRTNLRPPEIAAIEATFEQQSPMLAESLQVRNNLSTTDQTQAAAVDTARFDLFKNAASIDPESTGRALYLGFDKPIAVNPLSLFVEVQEQQGRDSLNAEVLTALGWRSTTVLDQTEGLRRRGFVTVFLNDEAVRTRLFDTEGFWIRLRSGSGSGEGPVAGDSGEDDWQPVVRGMFPNAVTASQATTIEQEIIGTSLGEPSLTVTLSESPVLPDSLELRIREPLSDEEIEALEVEQLQRSAAGFGPRPTPVPVATSLPDVPGTWVLWRRVDSFAGLDGDARVYRLDSGQGTVAFGDGRNGKIPPAGRDAIRAFRYQRGGGFAGNLPAWTELSLQSSLESVELVALPIESAGGVDAPVGELAFADAPNRLRHAGQALTPIDIESLAVASSPDIVNACCFPPVGATDQIRVVIAQRTGERCPQPTAAVKDVLARRLKEAGWGGLPEEGIVIDGPTYVPVSVTVELTARADRVGQVEESAKRALVDFLDPIDGGPEGGGWAFGRRVWPSDILRVLEQVNDVDRVLSFDLTVTPPHGQCASVGLDPQPDSESIPLDGLICALSDDIDVRVEPTALNNPELQ